jgi:acyl transferase domain-containing protein
MRDAAVEPIAIIGMAVKVPGANSVDEYWRNLVDGVESVRFFTNDEQKAMGVAPSHVDDPGFVPAVAMVDNVGHFDAGFFAMTPREAEIRDPQQRLFLELSHTALEDAGYDPARYDGEIGVYGGTGSDGYQWRNIRRNAQVYASTGPFMVATATHPSYLSTFTSYKLDLRGPSLTVHTACSTSLVAVHLACEALRNRECEMALAGAASIEFPYGWGYIYSEGGVMSPDGHCRAFDAEACGTLWGSGGGVVLLKRLADAVTDGDAVRAVILANAINNDGAAKVGFTAPSASGQTAVISQALGLGGVDPRSISYVEAHGTGTALGDPIEVAALSSAFGAETDDTQWCALGSVKTNIGHLSAASGVAGLVKAVLGLQHRMLPASLHFERPHPKIDFAASPFYVNATLAPWPAGAGPRRAGVSSFGVGGTNAHVILEEPPAAPSRPARASRDALLQISARSPDALATVARQLADHLTRQPELDLADVAFTLRQGRRAHEHRGYVVAVDTARAAMALADPASLRTGRTSAATTRVAFLFSGQGSQYPDMGGGLYRSEPVYRAAVDECAELLRAHLDRDIRDVIADPAGEWLGRTRYTQPALFTVEYALAALWSSWGVEPAAMLGHSIGEYVAATLAGVFALPDALRLVARRGALMQALPAGAMLAVPLREEEVRETLPASLSIAAVNAAASCVVSGPADIIDEYAAALTARSVPNRRLRTSHAFHSAMMEPVMAAFHEQVAAVPRQMPARPMLSNLTGAWAGAELVEAAYWTRHLREPVRFADGLATLLAEPGWSLVEVGPGSQLAGLARQHPAAGTLPPLASLPGPDEAAGDLAAVLAAAGGLWVRGVGVHPSTVDVRRVPLPTYPFEGKNFWVEATDQAQGSDSAAPSGPRPLDDWFAVPVWRQLAPTPVPAEPPADDVLVIGSAVIADGLRAAGCAVRHAASVESAAAGLAGRIPPRIVHAGAWPGRPSGPDPDTAWAAQEQGFFGVLALAQALAAAQPEHTVHLDILTSGTHGVLGNDLVAPEHATLAGPVLTLPLELPWLTARQVDGSDAAAVVAELLRPPAGGPDTVVLRAGRRWVREWEQVRLADRPGTGTAVPTGGVPAAGVPAGGVWLVTGGLGGIGITIAEDLAARERARIVLLSRTPLPDESTWDGHLAVHGPSERIGRAIAAVRRMRAAGAEVLVLDGDVTKVADLERVRAAILARFGRLDAIVHAAGVPGGGMAEVKHRDAAEAVLAPKVRGTLALSQVFGDLPLSAVVLCASVTGVAGGFGQVDYCGANAFLDAVAQAGTAFAGRTVSIDWGSWLEVGMAAEVAAPDAFRALQRGVVSTPVAHPVLAAVHRTAAAGGARGAAWCSGTIGPHTHWVLDEHRLAGRAVLPGTGYLATAVAATRAVHGADGLAGNDGMVEQHMVEPHMVELHMVELRDVALLEPLVVEDDGQTEIRVAFADLTISSTSDDGRHDDSEFQLSSRSGGQERVHMRGSAMLVAAPPAPVHDLAEIQRRCSVSTVEQDLTFSRTQLFTFGPRWRNLRGVAVGVGEELARLEAPGLVARELDSWGGLHPALLDEAVSFAASRVAGKFMPMGYGRLLVRAPLPPRFWSHVRFRDTDSEEILVVDVTMIDDAGTELLTITDLVLRRIDADSVRADMSSRDEPGGTGHRSARAVPGDQIRPSAPAAAVDANGIGPGDGVTALRRILAAQIGPQVLVAPMPAATVIAGARALTQRSIETDLTPAASERGLDGDYVAPATEVERVLCELWRNALGLDRLGVHDDFFAAGGNSLVAVQLLAGIRQHTGQRVPMRTLFEAATVARMAMEIERLRAAGSAAAGGADDESDIVALPRGSRA